MCFFLRLGKTLLSLQKKESFRRRFHKRAVFLVILRQQQMQEETRTYSLELCSKQSMLQKVLRTPFSKRLFSFKEQEAFHRIFNRRHLHLEARAINRPRKDRLQPGHHPLSKVLVDIRWANMTRRREGCLFHRVKRHRILLSNPLQLDLASR